MATCGANLVAPEIAVLIRLRVRADLEVEALQVVRVIVDDPRRGGHGGEQRLALQVRVSESLTGDPDRVRRQLAHLPGQMTMRSISTGHGQSNGFDDMRMDTTINSSCLARTPLRRYREGYGKSPCTYAVK